MKKKQKRILLVGAMAALTLTTAFSFGALKNASADTSDFVMYEGASVRMGLDLTTGIRFRTDVGAKTKEFLADKTDVTFGTLIVPTEKLTGENTELDISDVTNGTYAKDIVTQIWMDEAKTYWCSAIVGKMSENGGDFLEEEYATELTARSYVAYKTENGTAEILYAANEQTAAIVEVASAALADGEKDYNNTLKHICNTVVEEVAFTQESVVMKKNDTLEAFATPKFATAYQGAKNISVKYVSDNEDVVTVVNGVLTAVGNGTATVTASVGDRTDTISVSVVSVILNGSANRVLLNKSTTATGYENAVSTSFEVETPADAQLEWVVESAPMMKNEELVTLEGVNSSTLKVTAKENTMGGEVTFSLKVNGEASGIVCTTQVYIPISSEADIVAMNGKSVAVANYANYTNLAAAPTNPTFLFASTLTGVIPGWYLLTNDIVMQNNVGSYYTTTNGTTHYTRAVIGQTIGVTSKVTGSAFVGVFDGNGYTISDLRFTINALSSDAASLVQGLFGYNAGTIRNLGVTVDGWKWADAFPDVSLRYYAGAIAGINQGYIHDCYLDVEVNIDTGSHANTGKACAAIAYYNVFSVSKIENNFVNIEATKCHTGTLATDNVGAFVGLWLNGQMHYNYALASGYTDNVKEVAKAESNSGGDYSDNYIAKSITDESLQRVLKGERFSAPTWKVTIDELGNATSIALVKGCTLAGVTA